MYIAVLPFPVPGTAGAAAHAAASCRWVAADAGMVHGWLTIRGDDAKTQ
jgi:hypothetical protein